MTDQAAIELEHLIEAHIKSKGKALTVAKLAKTFNTTQAKIIWTVEGSDRFNVDVADGNNTAGVSDRNQGRWTINVK